MACIDILVCPSSAELQVVFQTAQHWYIYISTPYLFSSQTPPPPPKICTLASQFPHMLWVEASKLKGNSEVINSFKVENQENNIYSLKINEFRVLFYKGWWQDLYIFISESFCLCNITGHLLARPPKQKIISDIANGGGGGNRGVWLTPCEKGH